MFLWYVSDAQQNFDKEMKEKELFIVCKSHGFFSAVVTLEIEGTQ